MLVDEWLVHKVPMSIQVACFTWSLVCRLGLSYLLLSLQGRRGGLMVRVLYSGSRGVGSGPGRGYCVVFLGKTLYSDGASLHPGV